MVEGGTGNTVQSSRTSGQQFGIWIRNQATGTQIVNNRILEPAVAGIRLGPGLGQTDLLGNRISGGPVGIRSDGSSATWLYAVLGLGALAFGVGGATVARRAR